MNTLTTKYTKKNAQSAQRVENKHPESLSPDSYRDLFNSEVLELSGLCG
jgi:hypothetical protein